MDCHTPSSISGTFACIALSRRRRYASCHHNRQHAKEAKTNQDCKQGPCLACVPLEKAACNTKCCARGTFVRVFVHAFFFFLRLETYPGFAVFGHHLLRQLGDACGPLLAHSLACGIVHGRHLVRPVLKRGQRGGGRADRVRSDTHTHNTRTHTHTWSRDRHRATSVLMKNGREAAAGS